MKKHFGSLMCFAVCLVSLSLYVEVFLVNHPPPLLQFLTSIELKTLDLRFSFRGPVDPRSPVVIVAIDQKSEDTLGRWPFPRKYFAETVDALREAGARVIAFDVNFPQPDQNSALEAIRQVHRDYEADAKPGMGNPAFTAQLKSLEDSADSDRAFAEALSRFDNVVLGYFFLRGEEAKTQNTERLNDFLNYLSFQAYPSIVHPEYAEGSELLSNPQLQFDSLSPNLGRFAACARNFGYFNIIPDSDGTVRREPVLIPFRGSYYPSLDVAAALAYTNIPLDQVNVIFNPNGLERIDFGRISLPTDSAGYVQIDYYGPARTFPTYSLFDVIARKVPADKLKDRLVLVGATALGIGDTAVTPFQQMNYFGVEAHANFITNILQGRFIHRGNREIIIDLLTLLCIGLVGGLVLAKASPWRATAVAVLLLIVFWSLAGYLFAKHRMWIAVVLPSATLAVNYASIISYRLFFEEREKRKIRGVFQHYVHPAIVEQMVQHPEALKLGGEEKELTAMFCDIRGFTTLSEKLSPTALVELLNEFFSAMTDVVFRNGGTLDKYIGDAIMAFWGAPYAQTDHALKACHAALEMLGRLGKLQTRWETQSFPRVNIGIGINTGPMVVGNTGSEKRFNYTIMGDNVNLASRLEGINKEFGIHIIVGEATWTAVHEDLVTREIDLIRVQGKTKPVRIFEVLGLPSVLTACHDLVDRFHQGLEEYRNGQWEKAQDTFERLTVDYPQDTPSRVFLKRCSELSAHPPEGQWDGVYVMRTK